MKARAIENGNELNDLLERLVQGSEQLAAIRDGSGDARDLAALEDVLRALDRRLRTVRNDPAPANREKLEKLFEALGVLTHKINNPLTALMGRAQILQFKHGGDAQVSKAAAVIEESAKRVASYVRDLGRVVEEARAGLLHAGSVTTPDQERQHESQD